ncbi:MAG: hypothetical protein EXS55_03230 [Candidatus Magasanikbacteria bacterium]|nr:hypothetical protein [Candidatus Magasanikbacteria bacterium]
MQVYKTKAKRLSGSDFREVHRQALELYVPIKKRTKRRPYLRSAYFKKDKIFLGLFWHHLYEKPNFRDKIRRLKFFPCAIELLQNSRFEPESKQNPNRHEEILHRFYGITAEHELFYVQIKEDKRSGQKFFISVYPEGV